MKTSSLFPPVVRIATLSLLGAIAAPCALGQFSFFATPTYPGTASVIGDFNRHHQLCRNGLAREGQRHVHDGHNP
jgi:hypothetical protein